MKTSIALAAAACFLCAGADAAASETAARRFALVVGSNASESGRIPLRYAVSDARSVASVLEQMGGVGPEDRVLLESPERAALSEGFSRLAAKVAAARPGAGRIEVIVYYSGHSDETGLLLGRERFSYAEMRQAIEGLGAQVRIAIVDSCASGALVRLKGGKRVAPFLVDASTVVSGHAFLTASSAEEAAQESDRIQGSFFTYALVTGLRGAADASRDGKVTLSEAYQYAFAETLARTEASRAGPQHPTYDIQLVGSGDLVLTDLRGTSAGVLLAEELEGRLYLRDASGRLVAEVRKAKGAAMELGLEPGRYDVTLDESGALYRGEVVLTEGRRAPLDRRHLAAVAGEAMAVRGAAGAEAPSAPPAVRSEAKAAEPSSTTVLADVALFWPLSVNGLAGLRARNHLSIPLVFALADALDGAALGSGVSWVLGRVRGVQLTGAADLAGSLVGAQGTGGFNVVAGSARGLQGAGAFNWAGSGEWLAQMAGGVNVVAGPLTGLQAAGAVNVAGATRGLQLAGAVNLAAGQQRGLQMAGAVNASGGSEQSVQLAGAMNWASGRALLQAAPLNISGDVAKVQLGVVNVAAKGSDVQIGVVNAAEEGGLMLGVLNLAKNGYLAPAAWVSDLGVASVGIKTGGRILYTALGFGVGLGAAAGQRYSTSAALGVHLPLGRLFVDVDLGGAGYLPIGSVESSALIASLRPQLGWQIARHFALVAGPTFNAAISWNGQDYGPKRSMQWVERSAGGRTTVRMFPGLVVGVQLQPG